MSEQRDYELANRADELARQVRALQRQLELLHQGGHHNEPRDFHAAYDAPPDPRSATGLAGQMLASAAELLDEAAATLDERAKWRGDPMRG